MTDDKKNNLHVLTTENPITESERDMEAVNNILQDPWRRSTVELGICTGHLVADHGPSLSIILLAKHLGLMIKSYSDPDLLEEGLKTVIETITEEVGEQDDTQ